MSRRAVVTSLLAGALALVLTPNCASTGAPEGSASADGGAAADGGVRLWAATWALTWDRDRVDMDATRGWSVVTDLGYRVHVDSGWIVDYSVSFGPCTVAADGGVTGLLDFIGVRSAHAHTVDDPSTFTWMHAEDLATAEDVPPSSVVFPANDYCRAHWLVAHALDSVDAPDDADLVGKSVVVRGTWEQGGVSHPLAIDTWWPEGRLEALDDVLGPDAVERARAEGGEWVARVTVRRKLGAMFDGIDFATASDDEIAGKLLDTLVGGAEIQAELWKTETE